MSHRDIGQLWSWQPWCPTRGPADFILFYFILFYLILVCFVLFCFVLFCFVLFLFYFILFLFYYIDFTCKDWGAWPMGEINTWFRRNQHISILGLRRAATPKHAGPFYLAASARCKRGLKKGWHFAPEGGWHFELPRNNSEVIQYLMIAFPFAVIFQVRDSSNLGFCGCSKGTTEDGLSQGFNGCLT